MKYYIDPDFRKEPNTDKPFCCICQREIKDGNGVSVTVDWDNWTATEGGKELIGPDCWKRSKQSPVGA